MREENMQKFACKNVMTIENAMVMVSNALVNVFSEYVCWEWKEREKMATTTNKDAK